tara:strand:+ start:395 stop:928 length:534 start_codon:yes stop_codon:yes gene_type:complete
MKQKKSSRILGRTTGLEILKTSIKRCLKEECLSNEQKARKNYSYIQKYRDIIIARNKEGYIPIEYFINFLSAIPKEMFSDKPIFYFRDNKWDSLGLLGEKIHSSTLRTKYLQLCYKEVGLEIARVLDNEVSKFKSFNSEKKRFIASLHYVSENLNIERAKKILTQSRKLSDERNKYE